MKNQTLALAFAIVIGGTAQAAQQSTASKSSLIDRLRLNSGSDTEGKNITVENKKTNRETSLTHIEHHNTVTAAYMLNDNLRAYVSPRFMMNLTAAQEADAAGSTDYTVSRMKNARTGIRADQIAKFGALSFDKANVHAELRTSEQARKDDLVVAPGTAQELTLQPKNSRWSLTSATQLRGYFHGGAGEVSFDNAKDRKIIYMEAEEAINYQVSPKVVASFKYFVASAFKSPNFTNNEYKAGDVYFANEDKYFQPTLYVDATSWLNLGPYVRFYRADGFSISEVTGGLELAVTAL